ncbi:zf-HC2 domain-containing protein [Streptacidiphilus monticola]
MSEQQRRAAQVASGLVELKVAPRTPPVPEEHLGDRLAAFVDGELDHGARERIQSHLAGCAQCLAEVEVQRRLKSRLREVPSPAPSDVFLSRLMGLAAQEQQPTDRQDPPAGAPMDQQPSNVRPLFGSGGLGAGSFGRGTGLFGSGALGAEHPVPGVDPRAALVAAASPPRAAGSPSSRRARSRSRRWR